MPCQRWEVTADMALPAQAMTIPYLRSLPFCMWCLMPSRHSQAPRQQYMGLQEKPSLPICKLLNIFERRR